MATRPSVGSGVGELAGLLNLPPTSGEEMILRAFRAELKRLHPDGGGVRTLSDMTRLEALLAARDRWQNEASGRVPAETPVNGVSWFTTPPRGPDPRPGWRSA
jgi:hypothetical protein